MTVTVINTSPLPDTEENYPSEMILVKNTTGKGAFADLTYYIITDLNGGTAPPNTRCSTTYPDGYIYSVPFTSTILYYHA
ncbi:14052_t:CDS:2, partial [Cetraspora pellucida]